MEQSFSFEDIFPTFKKHSVHGHVGQISSESTTNLDTDFGKWDDESRGTLLYYHTQKTIKQDLSILPSAPKPLEQGATFQTLGLSSGLPKVYKPEKPEEEKVYEIKTSL